MSKRNIKKAVAITYLKDSLDVPIISAIGHDEFADMIIAKAQENGVKIISNDEFFEFEKQFKVGRDIPPQIYEIVAEILKTIILE